MDLGLLLIGWIFYRKVGSLQSISEQLLVWWHLVMIDQGLELDWGSKVKAIMEK